MIFRRRSHTPAECQHAQAINTMAARAAAQRDLAEAAQAALVDRLTTRYYAAEAIVAADHASGLTGSSGHLIGVCSGLIDALAEVTGLDAIVVGYRMAHGLSLVEAETCVVDNGTLPVILRSDTDVREPVEERLDRLRRDALRVTGHPMYQVLYGTVPA